MECLKDRNMEKIKVSAIIVCKREQDASSACDFLMNSKRDQIELEVLISVGNNPSLQRNEAADKAKGDFLLFLDNDQHVDQQIFSHFLEVLSSHESADVIGGPSLFPHSNSFFEKLVKVIFSSSFGIGPFRSRYFPLGKVRKTGEYELILSNLFVKKELFLKAEGFNSNLYPSEENEFLNRIKDFANIYYHPLIFGYRNPRKNALELASQMLSYGHGRMKHLLTNFKLSNFIFLIPFFFLIYILALPFWMGEPIFYLPFFIYLILSISVSFMGAISLRSLPSLFFLPILFLMVHLCYGLGLIYGLRNIIPFFYRKTEKEVKIISFVTFL